MTDLQRLADWLAKGGRESRLNERDVSATEFAARIVAVLTGTPNGYGGYALAPTPEPSAEADLLTELERLCSLNEPVLVPQDTLRAALAAIRTKLTRAALRATPEPTAEADAALYSDPVAYRAGWDDGQAVLRRDLSRPATPPLDVAAESLSRALWALHHEAEEGPYIDASQEQREYMHTSAEWLLDYIRTGGGQEGAGR